MSFSLDLRYQICLQPIELQVFNTVALELLQLLAMPEVEIGDVIGLINKDQALAVQVLAMANSSAYAGRYRSETIKEAVNRLGTRQIISIAMAASQAAIHTSSLPLVSEMMKKLWMHSCACASGSRVLANSTGNAELADQAYLAGLLHDVGKLYLLKAMERISLSGELEQPLDHETLRDVFSDMHIDQGVRIMNHWDLPPIYCSIVANHHVMHADPEDKLLAIVRLANFSSNQCGLNSFPRIVQPADVAVEAELLHAGEAELAQMESEMLASCHGC